MGSKGETPMRPKQVGSLAKLTQNHYRRLARYHEKKAITAPPSQRKFHWDRAGYYQQMACE